MPKVITPSNLESFNSALVELQKQKVGLYAGSFDPPHDGHRAAVEAILDQEDLDQLIISVTGTPNYKEPVSYTIRFNMMKEFFGDLDQVVLTDFEGYYGFTFAFETLLFLYDRITSFNYYVGTDHHPSKWENYELFESKINIVMLERKGYPHTQNYRLLSFESVEMSSSQIREIMIQSNHGT